MKAKLQHHYSKRAKIEHFLCLHFPIKRNIWCITSFCQKTVNIIYRTFAEKGVFNVDFDLQPKRMFTVLSAKVQVTAWRYLFLKLYCNCNHFLRQIKNAFHHFSQKRHFVAYFRLSGRGRHTKFHYTSNYQFCCQFNFYMTSLYYCIMNYVSPSKICAWQDLIAKLATCCLVNVQYLCLLSTVW